MVNATELQQKLKKRALERSLINSKKGNDPEFENIKNRFWRTQHDIIRDPFGWNNSD